jgi:hypothetical protein
MREFDGESNLNLLGKLPSVTGPITYQKSHSKFFFEDYQISSTINFWILDACQCLEHYSKKIGHTESLL